jgi:dTDP-4-amino-4,6-dideoxygalactose transaminase
VKVPFYKHQLGEPEIQAFSCAIRSEILTTGDQVSCFETEFSAYLGVDHSVALQSCTSAIHLALEAFGFKAGSEVITTPLTFVATALAILQARLVPVFCDIDPSTGNIDLDEIEKYISERTVAVVPVHLYGQMVDMEHLAQLCDTYNLKCIEDSAHCVEGVRNGVRPGQLSDAACFSFYATKNLTCGEGGCLSTNSSELAQTIRLLRSHGVDKTAIDRHKNGYSHWNLLANGWKYNLDNLHASILRPQLPLLNEKLMKREYAARYYELHLSKLSPISIPKKELHLIHARHLFPILVNPSIRDSLVRHLEASGIGVVINYRALSNYPVLLDKSRYDECSFINATAFGDSVLSLPLYPQITRSELDYVIKVIHNFF